MVLLNSLFEYVLEILNHTCFDHTYAIGMTSAEERCTVTAENYAQAWNFRQVLTDIA